MKRLFFAIAILPWLLFACNTVTFEEPQPASNNDLDEMPEGITGHYFDYDNQADLYITRNLIVRVTAYKDTMHTKDIPASEAIADSMLVHKLSGMKYPVHKISDTSFTGYRMRDTIYSKADSNIVLRSEGSDYFLNYRMDDLQWAVSKLACRGDVINLSHIETENEMKMLERITETQRQEQHKLHIKPSKEQLKKFIEQYGFSKGQTFLRTEGVHNPAL